MQGDRSINDSFVESSIGEGIVLGAGDPVGGKSARSSERQEGIKYYFDNGKVMKVKAPSPDSCGENQHKSVNRTSEFSKPRGLRLRQNKNGRAWRSCTYLAPV